MKRLIIIAFAALCSIALYAAGHAQERVLLYPSVDQNGDSITLSGMVSWLAQQKPKGIILLPHFTISADSEAPSNNGTGDKNISKTSIF